MTDGQGFLGPHWAMRAADLWRCLPGRELASREASPWLRAWRELDALDDDAVGG